MSAAQGRPHSLPASSSSSSAHSAPSPAPSPPAAADSEAAAPASAEDPESLLNEDPALTEKKSKKYEIKLKDLSKKHQELIVRGEAAASLLRAQVARLAALRRQVKFLKSRKQCWDDVLRPVKKRRADVDKPPVSSSRRDRGGAGETAGSRPSASSSSRPGNRKREEAAGGRKRALSASAKASGEKRRR